MSKSKRSKSINWGVQMRFELAYLGEGWDNCYIELNPLTQSEFKKIADLDAKKNSNNTEEIMEGYNIVIDLFKNKFVSGLLWDGKNEVEMEPIDFEGIPAFVIWDLFGFLANRSQKNTLKQ